jgi:type II secretory pathway pseudopilin PulG
MALRTRRTRRGRRLAFTLAESLIAATILAAAAAGVISPLTASHRQTESRQITTAQLALGHELLEEIAARPFLGTDGSTHQGPDSGQTTRDTFTSAGNYDGYTDTTSSMVMLDDSSVTLSLPVVFTRKVTVQYLSSRTGPIASGGDFAQVTVTVSANNEPTITLTKLLCRHKELF